MVYRDASDWIAENATMSERVNEYIRNHAREDPEECLCRGSGWSLSPFDTWEHCPIHYTGQPGPEDATP